MTTQIRNPRSKLNGESPHLKSRLNESKIIQWLYQWGLSTEGILTHITGADRRSSTLARLLKRGYLMRVETNLLEPRSVYKLTQIGLEFANQLVVESNPYPESMTQNSSLIHQHIRHDIFSQVITASAISKKLIIACRTPRQIDFSDLKGRKIQDVIWIEPTGERMAIEVEFTQKWEKKLDNFMARIFKNLQEGEMQTSLIVFNSIPSMELYRKKIKSGKATVWMTNSSGKLVYHEDIRVEQDIINRIEMVYVNPYAIKSMLQKGKATGEIELWMNKRIDLDNDYIIN